jgi:hypothetical protein
VAEINLARNGSFCFHEVMCIGENGHCRPTPHMCGIHENKSEGPSPPSFVNEGPTSRKSPKSWTNQMDLAGSVPILKLKSPMLQESCLRRSKMDGHPNTN